jgi:hypothetical protein
MSSLLRSFSGNVGTRFSKRTSLLVQLGIEVPRSFPNEKRETAISGQSRSTPNYPGLNAKAGQRLCLRPGSIRELTYPITYPIIVRAELIGIAPLRRRESPIPQTGAGLKSLSGNGSAKFSRTF